MRCGFSTKSSDDTLPKLPGNIWPGIGMTVAMKTKKKMNKILVALIVLPFFGV